MGTQAFGRTTNAMLLRPRRQRGFSLLELMMSLIIMTIVLGVAVEGMIQMQQRNSAENGKVDTVQQTRDFIDQMVRDIHEVGYPNGRVVNGNPSCANNANISCGLVYFSPTQIRFEGDLDGTGTVYQIWLQLLVPASGSCPCTLQRGVISKAAAIAGAQPTYYAEVNGVLNSGNGTPGASTYPINLPPSSSVYNVYATADVFDAYFNDATQYVSPAGTYSCSTVLDCSAIRSLQITVNVVPTYADPSTKRFQVYSITSKARLNN
jgi:prepilin-type N-terminal cleavage/methylation domain-containing protein